MKPIWNETIIAESNDIVNIEGNAYFPIASVNKEYLRNSETHSVCHWKGKTSYYSLEVNGQTNPDAVWYYPEPGELAKGIKGRVAFWKGVSVVKN